MVRESALPTSFAPGMIGFSNNKKGGRIIRFFTRSNISHTFVFTFTLKGVPAVQEASASVQIVPFLSRYHGNPKYSYEVYEVTAGSVTEEDVEGALSRIFEEFAGAKYGWFQILWFPYRWFLETVRCVVYRRAIGWCCLRDILFCPTVCSGWGRGLLHWASTWCSPESGILRIRVT